LRALGATRIFNGGSALALLRRRVGFQLLKERQELGPAPQGRAKAGGDGEQIDLQRLALRIELGDAFLDLGLLALHRLLQVGQADAQLADLKLEIGELTLVDLDLALRAFRFGLFCLDPPVVGERASQKSSWGCSGWARGSGSAAAGRGSR